MSAHSQPLPSAAPQAQPSPQLFFETVNAYQRTSALKAAIELDLFTAIAEGNKTADSIALRCQASQRGTRILADYLTVIGFLQKSDNHYALTPDSATFLNRHSSSYMGGAIGFLLHPDHVKAFDDVAGAVRKGGSVLENGYFLHPEDQIWTAFAESMGKLQTMTSELLAKALHVDNAPRLKVLDIAAGHGMFGITLARHNPKAEIVALDWHNVLQVARRNAEQAGVGGNWRALPGDAFTLEYGNNYDLVLLTNFVHHFDKPTNEKLLRKIHAALAPNGRLAMVDFIPNQDRVSPPFGAMFPLMMLVGTLAGDAYTYAEHREMLRCAGFSHDELQELPPSFFRAIIARK